MTLRFFDLLSAPTGRVSRLALSLPWLVVTGCSLVNAIDVCERPAPPMFEVNQRTEGAQAVSGAQPVAALATGGALAVFRSAVAADDDGNGESSIRIAVLDATGRPAERTCDAAGENELEPAIAGARHEEPSIAMPTTTADDLGLVVYTTRAPAGTTVRGMFVSPTGCSRPPGAVTGFTISDLTDASPNDNATPSVAWLGGRTFLVAWTYARVTPPITITTEVRLRVVRADNVFRPEFLPTTRDASGASVPVLGTASALTTGRVERLGDGRAALLWNEVPGTRLVPHFMVVDDRLATLVSDRPLDSVPPLDAVRPATGRNFSAAFDGTQIFVTWAQIGADGNTRVKGRFYDPTGASLRAPLSPDGAPFVVRDDVTPEDEGRVAAAALGGGGFFVAMEQFGGRAGRFQSLVARLFGPDGGPAFSNAACDARSFDLATTDGDLSEPGLARLVDGSVLLAYTSDGATGNDRSGTGVRATVLAPRDLLPLP
jgi:hypothetical protein